MSYILTLLKELDYGSPSFDKDKKFILDTMEKYMIYVVKWSSLKDLLMKIFPEIGNKDTINSEFNDFVEREKTYAVEELIAEQELNENVAKDIILEYEFSGKIRNDIIKESFTKKLGLMDTLSKVRMIRDKIVELVDKFSW